MNAVKISLVVPLHNVAAYLPQTLESIATQDFKDFEVILVEDGSTDETASIAREYVARHATWRLIEQPQQGVSVARNVGTAQARGHYVAYLDGDDWLMPHALSTLYAASQDGKTDLVQGGFFYAYKDHVLYDNHRQSLQDVPRHFNTEEALMALCQPHPLLNNFLWGKLIRKDIALACPNPPGRVAQDAFVMHEIIARCSAITILSHPIQFYRQRNTGLSGHFTLHRKDLLEAYEARIAFLQDTNRSQLPLLVMPEYARQIMSHLSAAQRTGDSATFEAFIAYQHYAQQRYISLWQQYAPNIWQLLKAEQQPMHCFLRHVWDRLFGEKLLQMTYKEVQRSLQ